MRGSEQLTARGLEEHAGRVVPSLPGDSVLALWASVRVVYGLAGILTTGTATVLTTRSAFGQRLQHRACLDKEARVISDG